MKQRVNKGVAAMNKTKTLNEPVLEGRYWRMPDGGLVPNIFGATAEGDGEGAGEGTGEGSGDGSGEGSGTGSSGEADNEAARLRKDLKSTRAEAGGYRRKLRELEDKVDGVDLDKYQRLVDQEKDLENKKLEDKGEYDKLLEEHQRRSEAQLQKSQESTQGWKQRYEKQVIDNVLLSAATTKAVSAAEAVTLIRSDFNFSVTDEGSVEITNATGTALFDSDGNPVTPQGVMASFLDTRPHLCKPTGGGTGSRGAQAPNRKPDDNTDRSKLTGAQRIAEGLRARLKAQG